MIRQKTNKLLLLVSYERNSSDMSPGHFIVLTTPCFRNQQSNFSDFVVQFVILQKIHPKTQLFNVFAACSMKLTMAPKPPRTVPMLLPVPANTPWPATLDLSTISNLLVETWRKTVWAAFLLDPTLNLWANWAKLGELPIWALPWAYVLRKLQTLSEIRILGSWPTGVCSPTQPSGHLLRRIYL